jgi:hypothetical protein
MVQSFREIHHHMLILTTQPVIFITLASYLWFSFTTASGAFEMRRYVDIHLQSR